MTIEKLFDWAWINGIDIRLESRTFMASGHEWREERQPPDFENHEDFKYHMPRLTFSKGGRHISVEARNFAELKEQLKRGHKKIFMDLCCHPLED